MEVISASKGKDTVIEITDQPEFLLFCELTLLFTRERVLVLGEVFIDLLVHILLLCREIWRPSISLWLGRRNRDVVYGGHDREKRQEDVELCRGPVTGDNKHTDGTRASLLRLAEGTFPRLSSFPVFFPRVVAWVVSLRGCMKPVVYGAAGSRDMDKNGPELARHVN